MPTPHSKEFRDDIVRVACQGGSSLKTQPGSRAGERDSASGGCVLCHRHLPKMTYPLVRDLAAEDIAVAVTCRVLGFSTQAFYAWCARPCSDRD